MNDQIISVRGNNLHIRTNGKDTLPVIVLLHGFTGSVETWNELVGLLEGKYKMVAIDLTGHGKSIVPINYERYSIEEQIKDLEAIFNKLSLRNFTLIGYSMGGRIALAYALQYPRRVTSLILESASPGLKTEIERITREKADRKLAEKITEEGLPSFVDFWEQLPLFASQQLITPEKQQAIREERLGQSVIGLSNSLLGIGTGSQPSYWNDLEKVKQPTLLITGEIDIKFVFIAREMEKLLPVVHHRTIKQAGHAIHVEKPTLFATMVEEHITKLKN